MMDIEPDWLATPAEQWQRLAEQHGTPFFLYDADVVCGRIRRVRDALQGLVQVYFAVKANPNLALLRALQPVADGVDVSSGGEIEQALAAGFDAACMSFAGPAKTVEELELAVRAGVGRISLESTRELQECLRIEQRIGIRARVALRVNPLASPRAYGLKMGGKPTQFGIDEEVLWEAEQLLLAHRPRVDFRGIHVYAGSQCFDPAAVIETTATALRIAREVEQRSGLQFSTINLGGGFGVSHGEDGRELPIDMLARGLVPLLQAHRRAAGVACEFIFELGRYLSSRAGIYVTRVIGIKHSRGKSFVICDGGLHHHLAAAGTFGAALRGNFPLCNLTQPQGLQAACTIAGPSCNPTDLLGIDARLPMPREGDLLGVLMAGSYGLTASPMLFLGRRTPAELVRSAGAVVVGRRPRPASDFS